LIVFKLGMIDFNGKKLGMLILTEKIRRKKLNMIVVKLGMIDFNGKKLNTVVIDD